MRDTIYDRARHWLMQVALPFWADRGVDRECGGFTEHLLLDGSVAPVDFKRVRVLARQIYVFSHASLLGFPGAADLARHGYEFLTRNAWLGPDGGWARRLDRRGRVIDPTPDLYDLAFVLFALGWYRRATGEEESLGWSLRTLDFIETHMRAPQGGPGFLHEKAAQGPRQQNPHIHLLEAALANLKAGTSPRFRATADELVDLFAAKFFCKRTQTLAEYYEQDWSRAEGEAGRLTEPGHQFEWAWILADYRKLTGRDVADAIRGLIAFAETHGVDRNTGLTFNTVRDDGTVLDRGSRTWPNTERIQAAVALYELDGVDPQPVFNESSRVLFECFLAHTPSGTWMDQITEGGLPNVDKIPASTLYHIMVAFAEMLRVEGAAGS